MIIKKAIKNEPWEVESFWEWIPSERRKMKETKAFMEQKILPFDKLYTKEALQQEEELEDLHLKGINETLKAKHLNASPQISRPKSAKTYGQIKGPIIDFETEAERKASKERRDKKKIEEIQHKKEEEKRKFETEEEAKNKNKNLLIFHARFDAKKNEEFIKYEDLLGWEKTPLIEELPLPPQKGKVPQDLKGKTCVEGERFKLKSNKISDQVSPPPQVKEVEVVQEQNEDQDEKSRGYSVLQNKWLQDQRESIKIQLEINKLMAQKKEIQPKTGKEAFGVHRQKELNSFLDMRKMMKVSSKVKTLLKDVKKGGYPGKEFADWHVEEMEEIREKLNNRSHDEDLEKQLEEFEYNKGKEYDEQIKMKKEKEQIEKNKTENKNNKKGKHNKKKQEGDVDQGDGGDLFGEEEVQKGDQAMATQKPKEIIGKKTTFLTQEKVEKVELKIVKTTDNSLKSKTAKLMDDLMKEIDFGDEVMLEEIDDGIQNGEAVVEEEEVEEEAEVATAKKKKTKPKNAHANVKFQNIKGWKMNIPKKDEELEDDLAQEENKKEEGDNKSENIEIKSQKSAHNETYDLGEDKKKLWQQEVLQGNHRAYLDDKQLFDVNKFISDKDPETRDKARDKVQADIQKSSSRTNKKIEEIRGGGGSVMKRSGIPEKSEKIEKVNSRFQKSLNQIKTTLESSKSDSKTIENKEPAVQDAKMKEIEKRALKQLKEQQTGQKKLKTMISQNEIEEHKFKLSQREQADDDIPHPWM